MGFQDHPPNAMLLSLLLTTWLMVPAAEGFVNRHVTAIRVAQCDAANVLRAETMTSAVQCAVACSVLLCGAYMYNGSLCQLYADSCSNLQPSHSANFYAAAVWECLGSSCYTLSHLQSVMTKAAADAVCAGHGGHLAAPETAEENDIFMQLVHYSGFPIAGGSRGYPILWIDLINDKTWGYSGEPATFTGWRANEPTAGGEQCTVSTARGWGDLPCHFSYAFVCESSMPGGTVLL